MSNCGSRAPAICSTCILIVEKAGAYSLVVEKSVASQFNCKRCLSTWAEINSSNSKLTGATVSSVGSGSSTGTTGFSFVQPTKAKGNRNASATHLNVVIVIFIQSINIGVLRFRGY